MSSPSNVHRQGVATLRGASFRTNRRKPRADLEIEPWRNRRWTRSHHQQIDRPLVRFSDIYLPKRDNWDFSMRDRSSHLRHSAEFYNENSSESWNREEAGAFNCRLLRMDQSPIGVTGTIRGEKDLDWRIHRCRWRTRPATDAHVEQWSIADLDWTGNLQKVTENGDWWRSWSNENNQYQTSFASRIAERRHTTVFSSITFATQSHSFVRLPMKIVHRSAFIMENIYQICCDGDPKINQLKRWTAVQRICAHWEPYLKLSKTATSIVLIVRI